MKTWNEFLKSLATNGGQLFILFVLFVIVMVPYIWFNQLELRDIFFLIAGALIGVLKGEMNKKQEDLHIDLPKETK